MWIKNVVYDYWKLVVGSLLLNYFCFRWVFFHGKLRGWRQVLRVIGSQIYFTAGQALVLIIFLGFGVGFVFVTQILNPQFGFANVEAASKLFFNIVIKEAVPLLTIMLVIARSITAITSELGNMKVNREIDALMSLSIHPINYVVLPRLVGGVTGLIVLSIFFYFFSFLGAISATSWLYEIPFLYFINSLIKLVQSSDFLLLFIKLVGSGFLIFSIATYYGLSPQHSSSEVPVVTTHAVVKSVIIVMLFSGCLTFLDYMRFF